MKEDRKKQITELVKKYYDQNEFLQKEEFSELLEKAINRFLDTELSIEEIEEEIIQIIKRLQVANAEKDKPEVIQANHLLIYSILDQIIPKLQEAGVDYHLAGALCGYLKYGEESNRCHEDLDFMVNEEDLDKFQKICEEMGFSFFDHRMNSPRVLKNEIPSGEHEVIATTTLSDFHIGVFCFERFVDGTFVMKGYYHDEENHPMCREEVFSSDLAKEIFDSEIIDYKGHPLSITSPEYLYLLKSYTLNDKDLIDIAFLKDKLDPEKLSRIQSLLKTDKAVQHRLVEEIPDTKSDELEKMVEDKEEEKENSLEKPKVLVKNDLPITDKGFAHKYAIVLTLLILAVIVLILFLVLKWCQII